MSKLTRRGFLKTGRAALAGAVAGFAAGLIVDVAGRDERLAFLGDCLTDEIQSLASLYDFAAFGGNENRAILDCLTPEGIAPARLNTPGVWRGAGKDATGEPGWSDGSITVPAALRGYMDGVEKISAA